MGRSLARSVYEEDQDSTESMPSALDDYLTMMVLTIVEEFDVPSEDLAVDMLFGVLEDLAIEGRIPEVPEVDDAPDLEAEWLRVAETLDLIGLVLDQIEE
jgi:hypothetical protein